MQILSYIVAAINITGDPTGIFRNAYLELTNSTNQVMLSLEQDMFRSCL